MPGWPPRLVLNIQAATLARKSFGHTLPDVTLYVAPGPVISEEAPFDMFGSRKSSPSFSAPMPSPG